jgi:hypothetical protein
MEMYKYFRHVTLLLPRKAFQLFARAILHTSLISSTEKHGKGAGELTIFAYPTTGIRFSGFQLKSKMFSAISAA